ncbi:MAG: hypothetical protein ABJE95_27200 [Byssovorax sp.]
MISFARRALPLAALVALASLAAPARAKDADAAAAEALFDEARRLLAAGDVKAACPKFAESYRLDPALGALLNLAACHEKEGRVATAWSEYRDAEAQAQKAKDDKRAAYSKKQAAALEPRLPRLAIGVTETPPGFAVTRNGAPVGEASYGMSLPIDPGPQELAATATGRERWTKRITLAEGARIRLVVPDLTVAKEAPSSAAKPPSRPGDRPSTAVLPPDSPSPPEPAPAPGASSQRLAGFAVGGVGLASLAAGAVFAGLTAGQKASADEHCPNKLCDPLGLDDIATARTFAWVSNITFGAGGALVLVGGILALTAKPSSPPAATGTLRVLPMIGNRSMGVGMSGSF